MTDTAPIEDVSSTEEHTLRQKTKVIRRKMTGVFSKKPVVAPKPVQGQISSALLTFADLIHDHSHLNLKANEQACALIADKKASASAATSSSSGKREAPKDAMSEDQMQAAHIKAIQTNPWDYTMLKMRLDALPRPLYYPRDLTVAMAKEQIEDAMRRRQLMLPVLTASHERKLLQEAGTFGGIDYPMCVSEQNCVSVKLHYLIRGATANTTGFPLISVMFEQEYESLVSNKTPPVSRRPCVLCCRKTLCDYVLAMRCAQSAPSESSAAAASSSSSSSSTTVTAAAATTTTTGSQGTTFLIQRPSLYQLYRNLVNQPGGFFDMYMLFPKAEEAILDPIVMPNLMSLALDKDETTGQRRLSQAIVEWRPSVPERPRVGENERNFGEGAGSQ